MISAAIIGTGNISQQHIDGYAAFPGRCKITHFTDIFPEKAEKKNAGQKIGAKISASYREILEVFRYRSCKHLHSALLPRGNRR